MKECDVTNLKTKKVHYGLQRNQAAGNTMKVDETVLAVESVMIGEVQFWRDPILNQL